MFLDFSKLTFGIPLSILSYSASPPPLYPLLPILPTPTLPPCPPPHSSSGLFVKPTLGNKLIWKSLRFIVHNCKTCNSVNLYLFGNQVVKQIAFCWCKTTLTSWRSLWTAGKRSNWHGHWTVGEVIITNSILKYKLTMKLQLPGSPRQSWLITKQNVETIDWQKIFIQPIKFEYSTWKQIDTSFGCLHKPDY